MIMMFCHLRGSIPSTAILSKTIRSWVYTINSTRAFHVLGIESSCDDTGVAIIDQDGRILSNCIHSQLKEHVSLGGVIPVVAKEYHLSNIDRVANQAFKESGLKSVAEDIDAIAVTNRPGLDFSLQVGLNYARILAKKYSKPLIPIHHMQAHALMPLIEERSIKFPYLTVLLSGGHCLLAVAKSYNEFHILGQSLDDAPGDLLDKVARRLKVKNLDGPFSNISGGASIELLAKREGADRFKYFGNDTSVPMLRNRNCDFSFAGYRGIVETVFPIIDELWANGNREILLQEISHVCASLQRVILIQIAKRLQRAILYYKMHWRYKNEDAFVSKAKDSDSTLSRIGFAQRCIDEDDPGLLDIVVSGGVAANSYITDGIKLACSQIVGPEMRVFVPSRALCSDNGLMVAWNGLLRYRDYKTCRTVEQNVDINDSVIDQLAQSDLIQTFAQSPIGLDIRNDVRLANFDVKKLKHPELRLDK